MMEPKEERKRFEATLDSLEPIRNFVTDACHQIGLDKKKTYGLSLAIDEIATNIIKHGYLENGIEGGVVDVTVITEDAQIEVVLEDNAVPFDPLKHALPDEVALSKSLEERPIGGLGVMIAQKSVDEFKYDYKNNRNQNTFVIVK